MVMVVLISMKVCLGEECIQTPTTWKISLISYEEATVSISWRTESDFCTERVIISQATDNEETISKPMKVSKGEAMVKVEDKCKLYTFRLAVLIPGRSELVYSSSKLVWVPSMLSTISVLSNLAILYVPIECPMPNMMVTACTTMMKTHCVSSPVSSYTETYLPGLLSCTMYTFSLDIHNTSIWSMHSRTAVNLQLSVSLSLTSGTLSTFYDDDCDISSSLWTLSYCKVFNTADGDAHDDDDEDGEHESSGSVVEDPNICNFVQIHPDSLETTVRIENLEPCTQYTFTMYTRHMLGDKRKEVMEEKVITEKTHCSGSISVSSEDAWHIPDKIFAGGDRESVPTSTPFTSHLLFIILPFILMITLLLIMVRRSHNTSWGERKPARNEVENLL